MWSYWICDTRTGAKVQMLPQPVSGPWSCSLDGGDSGSNVFNLADRLLPQSMWWDLTTPWARTLVVERNGVIRYAGIITAQPNYDHATSTLTVSHVDLETFLAGRYPFGVTSYWANEAAHLPGKLDLSGWSYRALASRVVAAGLVGPLSNYSLPVVLPDIGETGSHADKWENYNFTNVAEILSDIRKAGGGPDLYFKPRWSASNTLEWVLVAGSDAAPLITGPTFDFMLNTEKPSLTDVKFSRDGLKQITGMFSIGQGSGADMAVGGIPSGSGLPALIPARDMTQKISDEANQIVLAGFSQEAARVRYQPTYQWSFTLQASDLVAPIESIDLGSIFRVYSKDDPFIPDGWHSLRVVALSGDTGEQITPTVQTMGA